MSIASSIDCVKWSASYLKRKELMRSLEIPSISDTKEELGEVLANIVFDQCHEQLKEDFGLKRPLEGAGNELWVSPSDLLIGKVCLKPPFTQKHIQALTHQGILKIGAEIEQKYWNEMEREKARALRDQEDMLRRLFELQKEQLTRAIKQEEQEKYLEQLTELRGYYDNYIDTLVDSMTEEMRMQEERLQEEATALNDSWDQKLKDEVEKTVIKITTDFLRKMQEQEDILVDIFNRKIQDAETKRRCEVQFEKTKCAETLIQVKHCLECKNITNLMYLLCKERRKCKDQKVAIETEYEREVRGLQRLLNEKTNKVALLTRIKERKTRQVDVRERCLLEILKQFQKFIYFALRASPTQAEFLLDLDRMMRIQIENYCLQSPQFTPKKISVVAKPPITPAPTDKPSSLETIKEETNRKTSDEIDGYSNREEFGEDSDVLPAFYLNEKMYVREDFRDMFSKGVEIDRRHPLWNKDVEELMLVFKQAVQKERQRDSFTINSKRSHYSQYSSVHFTEAIDPIPDRPSSVHLIQVMAEKTERSPSIKSNDSDSVELPRPPPELRNARKSIMQASDSVELLKESIRSSRTYLDDPSKPGSFSTDITPIKVCAASAVNRRLSLKHEVFSSWDTAKPHEHNLVANDSLIIRIASMERNLTESVNNSKILPSTLSLQGATNTENVNLIKSSKLALHCDSLEILRSMTKLSSNDFDKKKTEDVSYSKSSTVKFNPAPDEPIPSSSRKSDTIRVAAPRYVKKYSKRRPIHKAHIVGNRKMKAHLQTPKEFTTERLNSLVNILTKDPSLMRLFTAVSSACPS